MILAHDANPDGSNFRKGQRVADRSQELAARVAEAQIDVLRVCRARYELIAVARIDAEKLLPEDWDIELTRYWGCDKPVRMARSLKRAIEKEVEEELWGPTLLILSAAWQQWTVMRSGHYRGASVQFAL